MQVINIPNGKPMKKGGVDFIIGHRFRQDVSDAGLGGAFGFDSGAVVAYGVRRWLDRSLSAGFPAHQRFRSNSSKTIEFSSMLHVVSPERVGASNLCSARWRRRKFEFSRQVFAFVCSRSSRAPLQTVFRSRHRRRSHSIRATKSRSCLPICDSGRNTMAPSLSDSAGVRVLRSTSIVGEYIPRLWGFQGEITGQAGRVDGIRELDIPSYVRARRGTSNSR